MKRLRILIYIFLSLEIGICGWVIYRTVRDSYRFLDAEKHFYFKLHEGHRCLQRSLLAFEECTPSQADSVYQKLRREGWIEMSEQRSDALKAHLDRMEACCPSRYTSRLAACIHEYERFEGLLWCTQLPDFYRNISRGFTIFALPLCNETEPLY